MDKLTSTFTKKQPRVKETNGRSPISSDSRERARKAGATDGDLSGRLWMNANSTFSIAEEK